MQVETATPNQKDIDDFNASGMNGELCVEGKVKLIFAEDEKKAVLFIANEELEKLGIEYIQRNSKLEYSNFCQEWFVSLSQNNYYNDLTRYPEKIVNVKFHDIDKRDGTEIYKCLDSRDLFMRQVSNREAFAKWHKCDSNYQDIAEIRANVIFRHGKQLEKITYDDWNGNAAYSNTFNKQFRGEDND